MNKTAPDSNESQLHLDAMLYLLEDPSLDRNAFEARLLEEPKLGEILANSVDAFLKLQATEFDSLPVSNCQDIRPASSYSGSRGRLFFPAIAASLFLACSVGWLGLVLIQSISSNNASSVSLASSLSLNSVVLAWGDLQADRDDSSLVQEVSHSDLESSLSLADSFVESDVPDWLVLAATDTTDIINPSDGKVFLQ